ncbi:MAG: GNAT family N-acetyltransferase [Oscillospiraceae bacterium]|nr:GNAT family N-acetyltransferase [Oscillospiraceae bacterium]
MNHMGTKTLETDRLILRKLEINDAKNYAPVYYERELTASGGPVSQKQIESLEERIKYFSAIDKYYWVIAEKHSGNLIGEVVFFDYDEKTRSCVIGYEMSVNSRNKGYMTEAVARTLRFLIFEVGFNRISGGHQSDNPASGRVMAKAGMKYEGTLRQDFMNKDGTLVDSILYSMIRQDME